MELWRKYWFRPLDLSTFIIGSSLWGFIWSTLVIVIYLAVGVFAFGVILSINIIGTIIVMGLGIGTFIGFSMIGAGVLILTKQGDPVTALITIATSLFGNVLFPPQSCRLCCKLFPMCAAVLLLHLHSTHANRQQYG